VTVDPVTAYARQVVAGKHVVSRLVTQACARHLNDLEQAGAKGLVWHADKAQRVIDFFAEVLILPENTDDVDDDASDDDPSEPRPFVLQPWQQFIVGSLFGWYRVGKKGKTFRRFREALIETAKGSGKTPLCAGMLLYMLVADGERGAQCFMAATTREQARLAFVDAERMVEASPDLKALLESTVNNLADSSTGSFLRAISAEKKGLDGKRVQGAMIDELHQAAPIVVNKMRAGTKGRPNALILKPTNSGFDRTSVLWQHHEYSRKVLDGTIENESWFAFICGLDPCQACADEGRWFPSDECSSCDDWKTEGPHWVKPNLNLGVSVSWQYVRERVSQAIGMPSEVSDVLRYNFCVWTQGSSRAIDMGRWAACQPMPTEEELANAEVYGGLDLGESDDLSAWARLYLHDDGRVAVKMRFWIPEAAIEKFPNRPYEEWKRTKLNQTLPLEAGNRLLEVTDGDVTDYSLVQDQIIKDCHDDGIVAIAYDPRSAMSPAQQLQGAGITMVKTPQGFALHEAIKKTLELVVAGELCHGNNKILNYQASNLVLITGTKGEKRIAKEKSPEKIDGMAAIVTGIDWAIVRRDRAPKAWNGEIVDLADYLREGPLEY
jgi:phage terminase large subunit-like protein